MSPASSRAQSAPAQDAPAASDGITLAELRDRYQAMDAFRAAFAQTIETDFSDDTGRIEGTIVLSPEQYRIETDQETLVTDGETTWVYSPRDGQVIVNDADADPTSFSPQTLFQDYSERFTVAERRTETLQGTRHDVLTLQPTDAQTAYTSLTLWVRRSDVLVTRLVVDDRNGSTITIELSDIEPDPSLSDDVFRFDPPAGVEVIDLRA